MQAKCTTGKRRYFSKADASAGLVALLAANLEHKARQAHLGIYQGHRCCGAWHIGHNFGKVTQRTARRGKHRRQRSLPATTPSPVTPDTIAACTTSLEHGLASCLLELLDEL